MKILFYNLASPNLPASMVSDYQLDQLLHGLKTLGEDVYESPYHWWMYRKELREESKQIWGRGFTCYNILDQEPKVYWGMEEGEKFDLTILGLHHTRTNNDQLLKKAVDNCLEHQDRLGKIIVVDGWDRPYICREVAGKVLYFKRELTEEYEDCALPISFAFPEEKIRSDKDIEEDLNHKQFVTAPLIPVNQNIDPSYMSTYIYHTEEKYYEMYQLSCFAFTSKKANYDALRHYEIIANGCIPLYLGIADCPPKTLHRFPTHLCIEALTMRGLQFPLKDGLIQNDIIEWDNCSCIDKNKQGYLSEQFDWNQYKQLQLKFVKWLRQKGTTKELAKYVLNEVFSGNSNK